MAEEGGEEEAGAGQSPEVRRNLASDLPRKVRVQLAASRGWRGGGGAGVHLADFEGTGRGARARTQVSHADFTSSQG